jgi:Domain of unknown function (DUF4124)
LLSSTTLVWRHCVGLAIAASVWCGAAHANAKVYRCTGANGQVTLSDRRCPEDEAQSKAAEAAKAGASAAQAAEVKLDAKQCDQLKSKVADKRKQPQGSDVERKALRQLEDEHRRRCG